LVLAVRGVQSRRETCQTRVRAQPHTCQREETLLELCNATAGTAPSAGSAPQFAASEASALAIGQIAAALSACDPSDVSIGDKAIIHAAIERLRTDATRADCEALIAAA
jgi:hypothetical protein